MKKVKVNNVGIFSLFIFIIIGIIILFVYFIFKFINIDNNKYDVAIGSIYYDDELNYVKTDIKSYLSQKFDGNYYLYQKEKNKTVSSKVGKNPVVYNQSDYKLYLYGNAYQIMNTGDVNALTGVTEIPKASPTKFFKLKDRKYLMVDSDIKTEDKSVKTSGYLIIELDKQGNPTFANNEVNVKSIGQVILKGTTMSFDIANEILIYNDKKINLKKIIGSTNNYKKDDTSKENTDSSDKDSNKDGKNNKNNKVETNNFATEIPYYDNYLKNLINSVNNLSSSANKINDKTHDTVKKGEIYYDFSKWAALKSVSSSVTSITVNYSVYDPNNEYQSVFLQVDDNKGNINKMFVNKNETKYVIRELSKDSSYTISFGYTEVSNKEEVVEDVVTVKTKSPSCNLKIKKIGSNYITYNLKIDNEYVYEKGNAVLYMDGVRIDGSEVNMKKASSTNGFNGTINYSRLGYMNEISLEGLSYNGTSEVIRCKDSFIGG